ncbi:MAG TPA: dolichyl-phosphate beta-glucosyltransferase [Herpetosiphonaceae bacterium]
MIQSAPFLSLIIPAYNESRRLPQTLAAVRAYLEAQPWDWELLVVDDGSSDETVALARASLADEPRARVIENPHRGKGYTVRTGMLAARGQYVLFSDADLAVPLEEWPKLQQALEAGCDVAIGSREGAGAQRIDEPPHRHLMGRVFNLIVRLLAVGSFQDTQCGFKAFTREAAHDLFARLQLYGDNAAAPRGAAVTAFDVEVLFLAGRRGYRIREVPVIWRYGEETKVDPLRDSWRNFGDVLRVRLNALRGRYRDVEQRSASHDAVR